MDDNSDDDTWQVIRQYDHDARLIVREHNTTDEDRLKSARYSVLINSILPFLSNGYVGYMCDNVEWHPDLVKEVNSFFDVSHKFIGYVLHERDVWDKDGNGRKGPASDYSHWDMTPPVPDVCYVEAMGRLDHSQVFHRLPIEERWPEEYKYVSCGDGIFFNEMSSKYGGIWPIANDKILSQEHLIK